MELGQKASIDTIKSIMPKSNRLHHIRRIDNPSKHYHAWVVQVQRRKKPTVRSFSDRRHGGKRKALAAALRYRNTLLVQANEARHQLWRYYRWRADNTSGIIGVGRYLWRSRFNNSVYETPAWQAYWNDRHGKRHSRWFSVSRYGEARAKALALRARKEAIREMFG